MPHTLDVFSVLPIIQTTERDGVRREEIGQMKKECIVLSALTPVGTAVGHFS